MKKLALAAVAVLAVFLFANRGLVHEAVIDAWYALLALAALTAAGWAALRVRRRPARVVRYRTAQPAAPVVRYRQVAGRPRGYCACGRLAETGIEGRPACASCAADWAERQPAVIDLSASVDPAGRVEVTEVRADLPGGLRPGETVGQLDMTEFEEAHRND